MNRRAFVALLVGLPFAHRLLSKAFAAVDARYVKAPSLEGVMAMDTEGFSDAAIKRLAKALDRAPSEEDRLRVAYRHTMQPVSYFKNGKWHTYHPDGVTLTLTNH